MIDGKSGVSGAGKEPSAKTHLPDVHGGVTPYSVDRPPPHRRDRAGDGRARHVHAAPAAVQPRPARDGVRAADRPGGRPRRAVRRRATPASRSSASARCRRRSAWRARTPSRWRRSADPRTGTAIVAAALDNLVKGAAGQAIQNANLMLGPRRGRRPDRGRPVAVGVTYPRGFRAAGATGGIKASGRPDVALVVADGPATAAGVFTRSRAAGAPVLPVPGAPRGGRHGARRGRVERQRQRRHGRAGPRRRRADGRRWSAS